MSKIAASVFIAYLLAFGLSATPTQAQTRSFVSAAGSDTNLTCTRTAPCRTFQWAFSRTNGGGEINVLDPAGYGPVTIDRDISIVNEGVGSAGILVPSGGTGITISGNSGIHVKLRGLIIEGAGSGQAGIVYSSASSVTIENCVIHGFNGQGIRFVPTASASLVMSNTFISDNVSHAIFVQPSGAGTVTAALSRVEMHNNNSGGASGMYLRGNNSTGTIKATVFDSIASNNVVGFAVESAPGMAPTQLVLVRSSAVNNNIGLSANGSTGAVLRIAQSTITGNATGWTAFTGGAVLSAGDNTIESNGSSEAAPPTYVKK